MVTNTKSVGVAFADPALVAGTTIDGAVITGSTFDGTIGGTTPGAVTGSTVTSTGATVGAVSTVAGAGTDQTNAGAISAATTNVVATGANGTVGVILPASVVGKIINLKNNGAAVLKVYPPASSAINALTATSGSLNMASLTSCTFMCTTSTQWFSIPLLPS